MNSFELYTSTLARSPSLTGSTSSRASSPAFPNTPQLDPYPYTNSSYKSSLVDHSSNGPRRHGAGNHLYSGTASGASQGGGGGASTVLARQQAMLERSTSSASLSLGHSSGLSRRNSVQSIKNKQYGSSQAGNTTADTSSGTSTWSKGHSTHNSYSAGQITPASFNGNSSFSSLLDDLPSYRTRTTSGDTYTYGSADLPAADLKSGGLAYSRPSDRLPFTSRSNTMPDSYGQVSTTSGISSEPSTPSYRESRFKPTRTAPLPNPADSAPTLSSFRSKSQYGTTDFSSDLNRPLSSLSLGNHDNFSSSSSSQSSTNINGLSSVASASRTSTHRHTKSVPGVYSEPSTPVSAYNNSHGGSLTNSRSYGRSLYSADNTTQSHGHGSRHGLDRLSEHYDQENLPQDDETPGRYSSQKKSYNFNSTAPNIQDFHTSPDLGAQIERHMPGASKGNMETHRGKGTSNRLVLSRKPTVSSSGLVLPSNSVRAMDISRHHLAAFEYLTHVAEAQAWLDRELRRDPDYDATAPEANLTSTGVVEFEQALRNGVALAKLARVFDGRAAVPRIYTAPKLAYAHIDNINHFFNFAKRRGLPEVYRFETNDLYNARNIPKVIYCIHALNLFLVSQGQAERMRRIDDLHFSESQLDATKKEIDHLAMPNFKSLTRDIPVEPEPEPEPEPETEEERLDRLLSENPSALTGLTANVRGALARRRHDARANALFRLRNIAVPLQSVIRGNACRQKLQNLKKRTGSSGTDVIKIQAQVRGILARRRFWGRLDSLSGQAATMTLFQARIRGGLARRHRKSQQSALRQLHQDKASIIGVQSAIRRLLAGQRLLSRIQSMRKESSAFIRFQAVLRGNLARSRYQQTMHALHHHTTQRTAVALQSLVRAGLCRQRLMHQQKEMDHTYQHVTGLQAVIRGNNARLDYNAWRWHIHNNAPTATLLQSLVRGHLSRLNYWAMHNHYHNHMAKVVQVQAVFRRKQKRQQYNELTRGKKVPLGTVKNFLHLLQDSDLDYSEEIAVESLRKSVISAIREIQALEVEVADLDTKIALMVKNKMSIDDLLRGRRPNSASKYGGGHSSGNQHAYDSVLAKHGDTFASNNLDRQSQERLELYSELFWILQTKPEYFARLFQRINGSHTNDSERRDIERVVMSLFGYAQNTREEYLLLKLLQRSLHQEILAVPSIDDFIRSDYIFIKLVVQYGRGASQRLYFHDTLSPMVDFIVKDQGIALETDPVAIYNNVIAQEESRTGVMSQRPKNVSAREALTAQPTLTLFTQNLQQLRSLTDGFLDAIFSSTARMPLGMRWIAREMDRALRAKFPHVQREAILKVVCHFVYYRYINPAIVAPENVGINQNNNTVISPSHRRALAEVSKMLNQISAGRLFDASEECLTPLNNYIAAKTVAFSEWLYDVIQVPDAEIFLHADAAYIDHVTSMSQAVYISPNEIYLVQRMLNDNIDFITRDDSDRLCQILGALGQPPQYHSDELSRARAGEIALYLTSRRSTALDANDLQAQEEARLVALMVSTKRMVLSVLKVQPGEGTNLNLLDVLNAPITEEHEHLWRLSSDQSRDVRRHQQQQPSQHHYQQQQMASPDLNNLEELDHLTFGQLKYVCLDNLQKLQDAGRLPSDDPTFQEMLDLIAKDIRLKNRKRMQRQTEKATMLRTDKELRTKLKFLDDQIKSYDAYISQTQATMHKQGKKRLVMPFSQQYWHQRSMAKKGVHSQFGSYLYPAQKLLDDGVLISIDQIDKSRFDQVKIVIRCNQVGVFELVTQAYGQDGIPVTLLYADLLDAQYNNQQTMTIDNTLTVHVNLLLLLIHKKFFA